MFVNTIARGTIFFLLLLYFSIHKWADFTFSFIWKAKTHTHIFAADWKPHQGQTNFVRLTFIVMVENVGNDFSEISLFKNIIDYNNNNNSEPKHTGLWFQSDLELCGQFDLWFHKLLWIVCFGYFRLWPRHKTTTTWRRLPGNHAMAPTAVNLLARKMIRTCSWQHTLDADACLFAFLIHTWIYLFFRINILKSHQNGTECYNRTNSMKRKQYSWMIRQCKSVFSFFVFLMWFFFFKFWLISNVSTLGFLLLFVNTLNTTTNAFF